MKRCDWVSGNIHEKYHDTEWGVPLHNDRKLFEFLILDGMQSGLSWKIILNKRKSFQNAFDRFDPIKISKYSKDDVDRLMKDSGIVRNRRKIESAINNAKKFLETRKEFGKFDSYIWSFTDCKTITNRFKKWEEIPATSEESENMSRDLKARGFTFVGPTVCYAYMQTIGMVNDHVIGCFRKKEIEETESSRSEF
jgi:DNA-3-methyladenine glycosylase I